MNFHTNQLDIEKIAPFNGQNDVKLNSDINITFTKDLNKSSILKNVLVIEDLFNKINSVDDLNTNTMMVVKGRFINQSNFRPIQGQFSYDNKNIKFVPNEPLDKDKHYCVIIRSHITSVYDEPLFRDYLFKFNTTSEHLLDNDKLIPPTILYPKDLSIVNRLDSVDFSSINKDDGMYIQISDTNDFNKIIFEYKDIRYNGKCIIDKPLLDGNYFLRVKTLASEWSELVNFYVQKYDVSPVSVEDDLSNGFDSLLKSIAVDIDNVCNVVVHGINNRISSKYNKLLIEIDSIIEIDDIDNFLITRIEDVATDEEIYDESTQIKDYTVSYDDDNYKTFIVIEI